MYFRICHYDWQVTKNVTFVWFGINASLVFISNWIVLSLGFLSNLECGDAWWGNAFHATIETWIFSPSISTRPFYRWLNQLDRITEQCHAVRKHIYTLHILEAALCACFLAARQAYTLQCVVYFSTCFQYKLLCILHTVTPIALQDQVMLDIFQFGFGRHSRTLPSGDGSFRFRGRIETMRRIICRGDTE